MLRWLMMLVLVVSTARADTNMDARVLLGRVVANRALKDFSLKARLIVGRKEPAFLEMFVKNTAAEKRTIYQAGTNSVMIVQPVKGEPRYFLRGAKLGDRLLGSDLTYYDLGTPFLRWPNPKYVGEERMRGRDTVVVEVKTTGQPYGRVKMWIDQEYFALLRVEAFDPDDGLVRRLGITSFKRIGEIWIPRGIEAATLLPHQSLPSEEKSRLEVYEGDYDAHLPGEWFAEEKFGAATGH